MRQGIPSKSPARRFGHVCLDPHLIQEGEAMQERPLRAATKHFGKPSAMSAVCSPKTNASLTSSQQDKNPIKLDMLYMDFGLQVGLSTTRKGICEALTSLAHKNAHSDRSQRSK